MSAYRWPDLQRALLVAAVVGTTLVLINYGPAGFAPPPSLEAGLRRALNYAVPFTVSSVSSWLANRARAVPPRVVDKARA